MRKPVHELCIKEARSNSTNNLLDRVKNLLPPAISKNIQQSHSKLPKDKITSAINTLASNKRYSILTVPKTPNTYTIPSENTTPTKPGQQVDLLSISTIADTRRTSTQSEYKGNFKFSEQNSRIRIGRRYRRNPNEENLKVALQEIEKNPSKKIIICENRNNRAPITSQKSDIEVLLESQGNLPRITKSTEKKVEVRKIEQIKREMAKEPIEMSFEVESQVSDPSPVREKKFEFKRSQTPIRKKKLSRNNSKIVNFLTKSKIGREFIEKYQEHQDLSAFNQDTPTVIKESVNLTLQNYRQESLKILKNTSFFANKIMKAIRCPARVKKCYYLN